MLRTFTPLISLLALLVILAATAGILATAQDQPVDDPRGDNAAIVKYRDGYWLAWDTEGGGRVYFDLADVNGFIEGSTLTINLRCGRSVNTWIRPDELAQLVGQVPELKRTVIAEVKE